MMRGVSEDMLMNETEKRYEKTAVVTGASKGIGYEICKLCSETDIKSTAWQDQRVLLPTYAGNPAM